MSLCRDLYLNAVNETTSKPTICTFPGNLKYEYTAPLTIAFWLTADVKGEIPIAQLNSPSIYATSSAYRFGSQFPLLPR